VDGELPGYEQEWSWKSQRQLASVLSTKNYLAGSNEQPRSKNE